MGKKQARKVQIIRTHIKAGQSNADDCAPSVLLPRAERWRQEGWTFSSLGARYPGIYNKEQDRDPALESEGSQLRLSPDFTNCAQHGLCLYSGTQEHTHRGTDAMMKICKQVYNFNKDVTIFKLPLKINFGSETKVMTMEIH